MTPLGLGALAVLLAGLGPRLLLGIPQLRLVPRAAMVLWQATALAAVLAAAGAGLSLVTANVLRSNPSVAGLAVAAFALAITLVVAARALWTGHRLGMRLRVLRWRHRALVDVLADDDAGLRVLTLDSPMAYCLPGVRRRVVITSGTLSALEPAELSAVIAHERAHLRARHDLVLEAFTVLHTAFPRLLAGAAALGEVRLLVEILADRAAVRQVGVRPVATALVAMAAAVTPQAALGVAGGGLVERVELLADTAPHRLLAAAVYTSALLVLVLPTVFVAYPWLHTLPH